jgi:hypothetical protein
MENSLITDAINGSEDFLKLQTLLFSKNIFWSEEKELKKKVNNYNNDEFLILIIIDNKILWTSKSHGLNCKYNSFKKISIKDFIKEN